MQLRHNIFLIILTATEKKKSSFRLISLKNTLIFIIRYHRLKSPIIRLMYKIEYSKNKIYQSGILLYDFYNAGGKK